MSNGLCWILLETLCRLNFRLITKKYCPVFMKFSFAILQVLFGEPETDVVLRRPETHPISCSHVIDQCWRKV